MKSQEIGAERVLKRVALGIGKKKLPLKWQIGYHWEFFLAMNGLEGGFEVLNLPDILVNLAEKVFLVCLNC
ncbi:hypothetical protein [Desulfocapsa sulfexigens]|uniref:hypothetical protein n=1 Tax=Desulfocapsa sulfexigens TaxID=65555 RepID=UPI00129477CD|nr:hypothetical protein [Desulfocapsa sulfexigens]